MEGVTQPTREITVENNTFHVDGDYSSFLVDNMTATEAMLKGNKLSGIGPGAARRRRGSLNKTLPLEGGGEEGVRNT